MARKELHTGDMPIAQQGNVDLSLDSQIIHGEDLPNVAHDGELFHSHAAQLAFMEEPVTIQIAENSSAADFPETHVPVCVNGRGAEVLNGGKWIEVSWLPIAQIITTKRKYVEVLARSKSMIVNTKHDDANVERPRNWVERRNKSQYPLSIIEDKNPRGHEWLSRILMSH